MLSICNNFNSWSSTKPLFSFFVTVVNVRFLEFNGCGDVYFDFVDEGRQFKTSVWKEILSLNLHQAFLKKIERFFFLLHDQHDGFGERNWGEATPRPCRKRRKAGSSSWCSNGKETPL